MCNNTPGPCTQITCKQHAYRVELDQVSPSFWTLYYLLKIKESIRGLIWKKDAIKTKLFFMQIYGHRKQNGSTKS